VILILEVYLHQHHTETAAEEEKTENSPKKKILLGRPYEPYFIIDIYYI
jgi:hypothetical protein